MANILRFGLLISILGMGLGIGVPVSRRNTADKRQSLQDLLKAIFAF